MHRAVIVRTAKEIHRQDGSAIRFDRNAAVLINPQGEPDRTRIFGPVTRELRARWFMKIISWRPRCCGEGAALKKFRIKRGDRVVVLTGRDRGRQARCCACCARTIA